MLIGQNQECQRECAVVRTPLQPATLPNASSQGAEEKNIPGSNTKIFSAHREGDLGNIVGEGATVGLGNCHHEADGTNFSLSGNHS